VTKNSAGVPVSWTFTQNSGGAPVVNTMSYDAADWLTVQKNNGTTSACTGDKRTTDTWTPTGREATRTVAAADSTCAYTTKQKTTWTYFDNGKLHTDAVTNGSGTVLETHTVGYENNGIFIDGNRTTDAFALNGPSSTVCTGSTASCTATYTYDGRDRLVGSTDGHGGTTSYTFDQNNSADSSIRAGNITTETTPQGTTTNTYKGDQLTSVTKGGVTNDYWYDPLGRVTCVTTTAGNASSCNSVTTGGTVSAAVVTANSYDFMDRFTATRTYSAGTLTSKATYSYAALDRTAQEVEIHPSANINRTTTFAYEGLTNLVTQEVQQNTGATTNTDTKTYDFDAYGNRISLKDSNLSGGTTTTSNFTYGYDVHGDVSTLVNQSNGSVKASYGYTPYGTSDTTLSKGDTSVNTPFNPYRYTGKRLDSGSQTYDSGARRYDPSSQRFLQFDQFQGALADLALASDPLTQNRYDLGASNPLSGVEYDGHMFLPDGGGGSAPSPQPTQRRADGGLTGLLRFGFMNGFGAPSADFSLLRPPAPLRQKPSVTARTIIAEVQRALGKSRASTVVPKGYDYVVFDVNSGHFDFLNGNLNTSISLPQPKVPLFAEGMTGLCPVGSISLACAGAGGKSLQPENPPTKGHTAEPESPPDLGAGTNVGVTITRGGQVFINVGTATGGTGVSFSYRMGKLQSGYLGSHPTDEDIVNFASGLDTSVSYGVAGATVAITTSPSTGMTAREVGWTTGSGPGYTATYGIEVP
jgi:RHS repeat-associated protein